MFDTVRKGLRLIGPERRRRFLMVGALAVVVSAIEALSALLILVILRFILEPGRVPEFPIVGDISRFFPGLEYSDLVLTASGIFAAFFVVRGGLFLWQQHALAKVAENTGVLLADRLVDGYLGMPYEFHLRRNSSELIRNAYDNVGQIVSGVFTPMTTLLAEVSMAVAMLVVLLVASVQATLVAAVLMGLMIWATFAIVQPRLKGWGRQRQRAARGALQSLQQGLSGLRDIKVLGKEEAFRRNFLRMRREMAVAQYHRATLVNVPRTAMEMAFLLLILGALSWAVARDAVDGVLSTLALFAYAGLRLQPSLQKIANAFNSLRYAEAAIDDLTADLDLLDNQRAGARRESEGRRLSLRSQLELRGVAFRYAGGERDALRSVDLMIRRGESIGIAGATGGGKTTLLDIICGLLQPTSGAMLVDKVDVRDHVRAWQLSLGVVHQSSFLIDDTVRRNVALGVRDQAIDEALLRKCIELARLTDVVEGLPEGLDTLVGERGVRLSGGQRQRITLARALYRQPDVLILDEGTAALDNETEREVIRGVEALAGDMTIIMVAHRLTTIERCDRIIYLEGGCITAIGPYQDLLQTHAGFRRLSAGTT